ncbi:hypothetical protein Mal35_55390 [Gimesia maris]|uniref:hypothetical protein n=1 Tax=Gimesia maris TaxID=122 RepID=UPI001187AB60|nr:hypothetical protein [Gimesia maris]QDT82048.1 hypothetical protein Mal35_55390 [Gimesia maris]
MFTIDLQELELLLDEVVGVVESPVFLSGTDAPEFHEFPFGDFNSFLSVMQYQDYFCSLDRERTEWPSTSDMVPFREKYPEHYEDYFEELAEEEYESPYYILTEGVLSDLRDHFLIIDKFSPAEISATIDERARKIEKLLNESEAIERLAKQIHNQDHSAQDFSHYLELIKKDITFQLMTIMQCRALTLDRRYLITELLMKAYQSGLFPYGWLWGCDTLFCLRPE